MSDEKKIAVCPNDGFPLVFTFMRSGAEYYCLECTGSFGTFEEDRTKETPVNLEKKKEAENIVRFLSQFIHTGGKRLKKCKKCFPGKGEGELHIRHLTETEKSENESAELIFKRLSKL